MRNASQQKLVTVIVPTIGRPQYIKDAVRSILEQDYQNIEILISDNYPEVATKSILGESIDSRIRFIERDRRYESSKHMNLCISDAHGYFVMILSDDDMLSPNYISTMVSLMGDGVMVGLGAQVVLGETDKELSCCKLGENRMLDGFKYTIDHFQGACSFPVNTYFSLFARREDIVRVGGFKGYPDGSHADNYLFYSLALQGKIALSEQCLMGYRVYSGSCGLSCLFESLYLASEEYDKDMSSLVMSLKGHDLLSRCKLRLLIKKASMLMMLGRLRTIYKKNMTTAAITKEVMKVMFCFGLKNIFYRAGK